MRMFTPQKVIFSLFKRNLGKKLLENRPVIRLLSSDVDNYDDIFKFYSDSESVQNVNFMSESSYYKFFSKMSLLREPAMTRQLTTLAIKMGSELLSLAEGMPTDEVFPLQRMTFQLKGGKELHLEGPELNSALQYLPTQGLLMVRAKVGEQHSNEVFPLQCMKFQLKNGKELQLEGPEPNSALQYLPTQGKADLLAILREIQTTLHRPPGWEDREILVTSGGQWGLYATAALLLDMGDAVIMPEYTYTGMISVLKAYNPEVISIPEDEDGIIPEVLSRTLENRRNKGLKMPKFLYIIPTGSNPTGTILTTERRKHIYKLACEYDFMIIEDDPYMFLNYTGKSVPSFLSMDTQGRVIRIDSFSKVICPGLRVGWMTTPKPIHSRLELHLQADHLHACTLGQAALHSILSEWQLSGLATQLRNARHVYAHRRDVVCGALAARMDGWPAPRGGVFVWGRVPVADLHHMVFKTAFSLRVMVAPGQACMYDTSLPCQHVRVAFSKIALANVERAADLLAQTIRIEQEYDQIRLDKSS